MHLPLAAIIAAAATPASATTDDVVVMRRAIAPAQPENIRPRYTGTWKVGDPVVTPGCTAASPSQAPVTCVNAAGATIEDARCDPGTRPDGKGSAPSYATCSYKWITGAYSDYSPTCSATASRTRTVTCQRQDAALTPVDAALCDQKSPDAKTTDGPIEWYGGCTYTPTYTETYGACINENQTTPIASCRRSDAAKTVVANGLCGADRQTKGRKCVSENSTCGSFTLGRGVQSVDTSTLDGSFGEIGYVTGTTSQRQAAARTMCGDYVATGYPAPNRTRPVVLCRLLDNGRVDAGYGLNRNGITLNNQTGSATAECVRK